MIAIHIGARLIQSLSFDQLKKTSISAAVAQSLGEPLRDMLGMITMSEFVFDPFQTIANHPFQRGRRIHLDTPIAQQLDLAEPLANAAMQLAERMSAHMEPPEDSAAIILRVLEKEFSSLFRRDSHHSPKRPLTADVAGAVHGCFSKREMRHSVDLP